MAESVVPGTYVEVRAEGLIAAPRVATGIVGVIGTAAKGPVGEPVTLSGLAHARQMFGLPDAYARPEQTGYPLTLVRALEHLYANGASSVLAVRVAAADRSPASITLQDAEGQTVALL